LRFEETRKTHHLAVYCTKIPLIGKNHDEYALDTVKMFARDSEAAGYRL
jgi:hypothetical protein